MRVSVICVYNNSEQLHSQLEASLNLQDLEFEPIFLDNSGGRFTSAAAALNHGAKASQGDILIFSHQDIYLKTRTALRELAEAIAGCETGTIVGTAGVKEPSKQYYLNLTQGEAFDPTIQRICENRLYPVSCVDEGLFGMTRATWEQHPFDEALCDNWHLYAVESCLWAREQGHEVFVQPVQLHHFSAGRITRSYMKGLIRLTDRYQKSHKYIWTTCYKVPTSWLYVRGLYLVWSLNRRLRGRPLD